jgi:hypothetical protein
MNMSGAAALMLTAGSTLGFRPGVFDLAVDRVLCDCDVDFTGGNRRSACVGLSLIGELDEFFVT